MVKLTQINLIAIVAIALAALLIAGTGLTPAAQAHKSNHNDRHHNGGTHISVKQSIHQSNDCSESICANIGVNNVNFGHQ
jgi:cobalt transporter subunit CbtB